MSNDSIINNIDITKSSWCLGYDGDPEDMGTISFYRNQKLIYLLDARDVFEWKFGELPYAEYIGKEITHDELNRYVKEVIENDK